MDVYIFSLICICRSPNNDIENILQRLDLFLAQNNTKMYFLRWH